MFLLFIYAIMKGAKEVDEYAERLSMNKEDSIPSL